MRLRLATNYGADDKFNIINDTIKVCHPFFDEVVVYSSAPIELANKWKDITLPSNCRVEDIGYYIGYYETSRRLSLKGLNTGDWVLWMDSDERPSMGLLQSLRDKIAEFEDKKIPSAGVPLYYHVYAEYDGVWKHETTHWVPPASDYKIFVPKTFEEWQKGFPTIHDCFFAVRLTRVQPGITMYSNFGGHTIPFHSPRKDDYIGHHVTHIKSRSAFNLSLFLSTYTTMFINYGHVPDISYIVRSQEFRLLNEFKKLTHIYTGNDLVVKLRLEKNAFVKALLKQTLTQDCFKNSQNIGYREYYKFGMSDMDLEYPEEKYHVKCGCECCEYGDVQL